MAKTLMEKEVIDGDELKSSLKNSTKPMAKRSLDKLDLRQPLFVACVETHCMRLV